jgi:hypothetical protein
VTPCGLATALLRAGACLAIGNALRHVAGIVPWILSDASLDDVARAWTRDRFAAREAIGPAVRIVVAGFLVVFAGRFAVRFLRSDPEVSAGPSHRDASMLRAAGVAAGVWALAEAVGLVLVGFVDRWAFGDVGPTWFFAREPMGARAMRAAVYAVVGVVALAGWARVSAFVRRWFLASRPAARDG